MITINEILLSPINTPMPFVKVFINSVDFDGNLLPYGQAVPISGSDGTITFDLIRGTYRLFFQQENGSILYPLGYILESVFDNPPSPVKLAGILTKELPEDM